LALIILCVSFFAAAVRRARGLRDRPLRRRHHLYEGLPLAVVFQRMTAGMNIFSFLAIPFFIFAGELMLYSGVADRIVNSRATWWAISAAGSACRTWLPARSSAACPARPSPMSPPWDR
jgi:TRAP-type mannitol/chloroaromatic compound transport system permease large subunit